MPAIPLPSTPASPPDDATLDALLADLGRNRSPSTVAAYRRDLLACGNAIGGIAGAAATLRALIQAGPDGSQRLLTTWAGTMQAEGCARLTIHRRVSGVRAIVHHAQRHGLIAWRIALAHLDLEAAPPRRPTRGAEPEQVRALLAAAAAQPDRQRAARDLALIWLLAGCGLRAHEARNLAIGQLDLDRGVAHLHRGHEAVPLPPPAVAAVRAWLAHRTGAAAEAPVFIRQDRAAPGGADAPRLGADGLNRIVNRLAAAAGVGCRPHALRHGAITMAARRTNGDAAAVRAYARHRSLATSQRYVDDADRSDLVRTTTAAIGAAYAADGDTAP